MNHYFDNYKSFRGMGVTLVYMPATKTTMCIHSVDADPHNPYVVQSGVTWGLRAISQETKMEYFCWFDDEGRPVDDENSICQSKAIDTILRRLMERTRTYRVYWKTSKRRTNFYSHDYPTEDEAVKKARQISGNPFSHDIRVYHMELWKEVRHCIVWSCGSILATIQW